MASVERFGAVADEAPRERRVTARFEEVLAVLSLDMADPHLRDTPARWAAAMEELLAGLRREPPELRTFPNDEGYREAVVVTGVRFHSLCAHHFLPFFGEAHVGYLPGERLVGLSKLARVVEHFARRPQVQERLTEQVVDLLEERLRPAGVIAVVRARHLCMEMRGVGRRAWTVTTAARGVFEGGPARDEFLARVGAAGRSG